VLKKVLLTAVSALALAVPAVAAADSCSNVSRAAPDCDMTCTDGPITDGNWVWLPSIGVPVEAWGKAPPGTADSVALDLPGANGNYTNGQTSSLLGMSNNCPPGNNSNRQTTHGIQSGCE
jgi:hypothetical protein